jgi:nucleoside-diphosphate-sugar epimerase
MRVFITGATGYIGRAVVQGCLRAGWRVSGLVRQRADAERLAALGVDPVEGSLEQPERYRDAARAADAFVHAASDGTPNRSRLDRVTVDTLLDVAAERPGRVVVYTSGIWVLGPAPAPVDETAPLDPLPERLVLDASGRDLRTIVIRPGVVFGGGAGLVGDLFKDADNGLMRIIGQGDNIWPLVYDRDLADFYVRLIAAPDASGVFHATDGSDETVRQMGEAIVRHAGRPVEIRHVPIEEARIKQGALADALALSQRVRSPRARALGWTPAIAGVSRNVPRLFDEWRTARRGS